MQLWGKFSVIISASSFLSAKKKSHYLIDIRYYKFLHGFFSEEKQKFHFVFLFFKIVVEAVRTVLFHGKLRCIQNAYENVCSFNDSSFVFIFNPS